MSDLTIIERPIETLNSSPHNARTHSEKQIWQIATSIEKFGFNNPVLITAEGEIIAGHGRVEAAKILGLGSVPTVQLDHLSGSQRRAYIIADNRIAELAGWDKDILAIEFQQLLESDAELDLTSTGFEIAEVDLIMGSKDKSEPEPQEVVPTGPEVARTGDLWLIGKHRLYCGDALSSESYGPLLAGQLAQMAITDPPYNLLVDGCVSGLGKVRHREFAMATGEMSEAEFTRFLTAIFRMMSAATVDGSIHYVCMDWRHMSELLRAGRIAYSELKNICVWVKDNGGMGSLYRSQHEMVAVFKNGAAPHINNIELGKHGRYRTNVWSYRGMNSFHSDRMDSLAMHPTVKPVGLIADAMLDCSKPGGIVLDPFIGSGTAIIAADRTARHCFGIELDPIYVDVALRRARASLGIEAVHAATGRTFSALEKQLEAGPANDFAAQGNVSTGNER
jgi:DNA modification methylase